ncbi:MAG: hypothetical protein WAW63_05120 [Candidatus Saccharimonadales bacterium]|jgi:hypothetical protein|nr:hypothetical protein [Candidatus Saccharibacteria bacterium]
MTGESLTDKLSGWYPDLFEPASVHADCYVGYPDVQKSILLERDLHEKIGNLVARIQFVTLSELEETYEGLAA